MTTGPNTDGLHVHLGNLSLLSDAETRSLSAENPDGSRAGGGRHPAGADHPSRDLGLGWKTRPHITLKPGETATLADVAGPGAIQSIWMTPAGIPNRDAILRFYWDGQDQPSVEVPLGDFFASAFTGSDVVAPLSSMAVCVNPGNAFNCYWPMPFRKKCRITVENLNPKSNFALYYQINYALAPVPESAAYFHAHFRRVNPVPYKRVVTLMDVTGGQGHFVGTYLAWSLHADRWWGEGEIKFYIDDDLPDGTPVEDAVAEHGGDSFPTICGTGTEDYFCGSYNFENKSEKRYQEYNTPYAGVPHIARPDGLYRAVQRFSMYRWHLPDPIRFQKRLAVTIQALGWRNEGRFLPLQDDIASVVYWYQQLPTPRLPPLPDRDGLEIL
jgi:hypothetical protein